MTMPMLRGNNSTKTFDDTTGANDQSANFKVHSSIATKFCGARIAQDINAGHTLSQFFAPEDIDEQLDERPNKKKGG